MAQLGGIRMDTDNIIEFPQTWILSGWMLKSFGVEGILLDNQNYICYPDGRIEEYIGD